MKTHAITTKTIHDSALEDLMQKRDNELKALARKNARHFAKRNLPSAKDDNLTHYVGEIKTGYDKLAAEVVHHLQPAAHFPEAKMDADYFRERDELLGNTILTLENQNQNDEYELSGFSQSSIPSRIRWAVFSTAIITVGEILFNTKAFQITGENLLFALILSICVSFAVFIFAHIAPFLYKGAKTKIQRIIVATGSLLFVTCLFVALAIFRSSYLAEHEVNVNPLFFVIINLFFFIVSTLLSFFVLPTWEEVKRNALQYKTLQAMKKRQKEIKQLQIERAKIKTTILERTKLRMRIAHHANYAADRIRKMYWESLEVFKTANLTYRTDRTTPDCFGDEVQLEPNIPDFNYTLISSNMPDQ
jgi:hypothetical protein